MRQPGNSRLFCVCTIDWPYLNQSTARFFEESGLQDLSRAFVVPVIQRTTFCFTQGWPVGWPPGSQGNGVMATVDRWLLPDGIEEVLPPEAARIE
ncbi:hypothetical protein, partial [Pseudomonas savastanoi]